MNKRTYLMCPPGRFWRAEGNAYAEEAKIRGGSNPQQALIEWMKVADLLTKYGAQIVIAPPAPREAFDAVYAADLGRYFRGHGFLLSNMEAEHRRAEPDYTREIIKNDLKLNVCGQARGRWEGSSCLRVSPRRTVAFLGYGVRACKDSCAEVAQLLDVPVLAIKMQEPHIHLDTLLACLEGDKEKGRDQLVLVCRSAFAPPVDDWNPHEAWGLLWEYCEREDTKIIAVSKADGKKYATNVRQEPGGRLFAAEGLSQCHKGLLRSHGFAVHSLSLPCLFGDGGGASACLTNNLTRAVEDGWEPPARFLYERWRPKIERWIKKYPTHEI